MGLILHHDTGASHDGAIVSVFLHRSDLCTSKPTVVERLHGMSRSGVLTQRITTVMHSGTHIDAPAHVVQGTPFMDEVPLPYFFGTAQLSRPRDS
jgi:kynurenine formamidase